jgi:hypothetical protein
MFNLQMYYDIHSSISSEKKDLFKSYKTSEFPSNKKRIYSLAWSKNGQRLVSGS